MIRQRFLQASKQADNNAIVHDVNIRFTVKEDLLQLPWLYKQNYKNGARHETDFYKMTESFDRLSKNEDYIFVSAMKKDTLVGFCSVVVNQDIVGEQRPVLLLYNLRVHPDFRNGKIGSKIMEFVENLGKSKNANYILLVCDKQNQEARRFYTRLGYTEDYGFNKYL